MKETQHEPSHYNDIEKDSEQRPLLSEVEWAIQT